MRRFVVAGGVAVAAVALVVGAWIARGRSRAGCLHVAGAHGTVFRGARLFDGEGMRAATDVLVVDGTIAAVGGFSCVAAGGGLVEEVDASGRTLLPGLIDSLDRAGDQAADEQREARLQAATFGVTTLVGAAAAEPSGADSVRMADVVRASVRVIDVATPDDAREAASAGAAGIAHWFVEEPAPQALVDDLAARRVFWIPTLGRMQMECAIPVGRQVLADPRIEPKLSASARAALSTGRGGRLGPRRLGCYANVLQAMSLFHGRATILAGTDAPGPGVAHGASLHRELELLVLAGLSPVEALRAATSAPAAAFGLSDRGRIAPGARADLVLVDGDPSADVTATRAIARVYERGIRAH